MTGGVTLKQRSVAMLLVLAALLLEALIAIYVMAQRGFVPPLAAFAAIFLVLCGIAWFKPRPWVYLTGGLLLLVFLAINVPFVIDDPIKPLDHPGTWAGIVTLALCPVAGVSGVFAFRHARRGAWQPVGTRAPSSQLAAIALAGFLLGTSYLAIIAQGEADSSGGHGVKNGVLETPSQSAATLVAQNTAFVQKSIDQKSGASAIYVTNKDPEFHTFDIDVDGQHYSFALAASSTTAVILNLRTSGSYTFWCAISGHRKAGMEGTLRVAAG